MCRCSSLSGLSGVNCWIVGKELWAANWSLGKAKKEREAFKIVGRSPYVKQRHMATTETFGKTKDRKPNMSMRHSRKIKEQKGKSYRRLNLLPL